MTDYIINFDLCKKDKKLKGNICCYMGVRNKYGCNCYLDRTICLPYNEYSQKKLEEEYKIKK